MSRHKELIEIDGVFATIDEHIENRGYTKGQVYSRAHRAGLSVADFLRGLPEVGPGETREPPSGDPYEMGREWDIEGCYNVINAAFLMQKRDLMYAIVFYKQSPTERRLAHVKYIEQWFRDALPNYYDIDAEKVIKEVWRQARAFVSKMQSDGTPKKHVKKADIAEFMEKDGKTDVETEKGL